METVRVNSWLQIPLADLKFSFSRSPGPGGQNVNKVATRVTLSFDLAGSPSLSDAHRAILQRKLATRITREGVLHVTSSSERSQKSNKEEAISRFAALVADALRQRKPRRKTRPTAAARERRLREKSRRGQIKSLRRGHADQGD
ncbi:MAG: aminoacyl-tRNA hydrolase [Planctomycetota bacterium]|nr:MAG: aminoacyl-tRNA hydrolase [Planctomycetota bacterium]